ncbi:NAD(P)-dependent oxidoreductase [Kallotenue papyrolyticum]|uniref:NAD(P)-dependent oxidoreductase n=1 Tax=Kallotenue papyrolyticum TaxID=1325125 RepID=UPI0004925944|nr:NAD(P)-dependent oxidoreductase [Kallotenue papyrolyticum]
MRHVALLGLGLMGSGMAHNLLKAGYELTVYNRTRARAEPLAQAGAQVADTPRAAAQQAEVVISMVADDRASRAVWLGEDGALAGAPAGAILIESSTLSSAWVRELAHLAAERGCALLDAPVRGSRDQAAAGELNFLVGGDAALLERVRPVLEAMGRRIDYLGPTGSGAIMKLINNQLAGVQVAALAEALAVAERAGLDLRQVVTLLINGAPGSPIVKGKAAPIAARDYRTNFALRWMHKDLSYALEEAVQHNIALPTVAAAREIYRLAIAQGHADQDFCAVAEVLRPPAD